MKIKKSAAGEFINSRCTRCKIITAHTIVAMVGERVARVKCNACSGEHNYHPPKEAKAPITRRTAVAKVGKPSIYGLKKDSGPHYQVQWDAALAKLDATTAAAYVMEGKYIKNTLIAHPNFGVGVVTSLAEGKMEVLFHDGPKWLCCRR